MNSTPQRLLGIDPGLRITGYAVLEVRRNGPELCEAGVLRGGEGTLEKRILTLHQGVLEIIDQFHPQAMAVEQLYAHYKHPRTAIIMGHARGVMLLAASLRDIPTFSYNATQVKKLITGAGRASKDQIQRTVAQEMGLSAPPEPPDVADAMAIALTHYYATLRDREDEI
ncbi:MAG TPA: crossover junction endodeoxyribonuclease RuvC [Gemmatales bacterium]|nr:crossover junction endodeoxyribonuclease RuvC [Gemmatales bacterium]